MRLFISVCSLILVYLFCSFQIDKNEEESWIRINLMGYQPGSVKVAVWCSKGTAGIKTFQLINAETKKIAFSGSAGKAYGTYGPFNQTYRLNFSSFNKTGAYYLQAGGAKSPVFNIGDDVYKGSADFCLRYMRQQRSGFNPFLKDSCHTHDGYTLYGPMPDSTFVDVTGGWHDASDYLQYSTTSANATYHLLMAYRDYPNVFTDEKLSNGLDGKNGIADVLDEARWGLDWLLKMHPRPDWMFNQIADDRDHISMRIPKQDSQYHRGYERPVYFITGEPQQQGNFLNHTTGTSSTAAKFASAFALGASTYYSSDSVFSDVLYQKSFSSLSFTKKREGVTQTVSVRSPYIYAEENWVDDMELALASHSSMLKILRPRLARRKNEFNSTHSEGFHLLNPSLLEGGSFNYAIKERITPWLGSDTAAHYQWYPFINLGHYELAKQLTGTRKDTIIGFYKEGINRVWNKAKQNAFYRGVPFIWCSNNLTTSFAIQCLWYRQLTGDKQFQELEQANFDWLFGCNPWGTSMVYGLPSNGDTPTDPHSAFTHLKNYPIDGGLVDGPVYGSIFGNLKGITLYNADEYAPFQSNLAVYHDDYGDYSTNEPTMDGTASLVYLLAAKESAWDAKPKGFTINRGAIIRGDSTKKKIALVFTGDEFAEGGNDILASLKEFKSKASFFLTGRFYRNPANKNLIQNIKKDGHYLGPHSNEHLLYCDWQNRDHLLVTKKQFEKDLLENYKAMSLFGVQKNARYFLPPYEWYNDSISKWTSNLGLQLINYTPGTLSHADYTTTADKNYRGTSEIFDSIINYEDSHSSGLNGFILLMHIGSGPGRTDKFYHSLPVLLKFLSERRYEMVDIKGLLGNGY